jgi:EAL domain-containing protein (putative c-di-GMP-specific phosphodiesterase class I)
MNCRCEQLSIQPLPERATLVLSARFPHTFAKLVRAFADAGVACETGEMLVRLTGDRERLGSAIEHVVGILSSAERAAVRVFQEPHAREATMHDYFSIETIETFHRRLEGDWLLRALQGGSITSHFQPIVHAQDPQRIFAREALLRIHDGPRVRTGGEAFALARDSEFAQFLDRVARETAITCAADAGFSEAIFINFMPSAIYDPVSCLRTTVAALDNRGIAHDRIVFEVVESDRVEDPAHLRSILNYYRERGFRVALDDVGAGFASLSLLSELRPDFIKLDMSLVQGVDRDAYKAVIARQLIDTARLLGVPVIAEGIETTAELAWVQESGAEYAQGFALGRPEPVASP